MRKITTQYTMKLTAGNPSDVQVNMIVEEEFNEKDDLDLIIQNKLGSIPVPTLPEPSLVDALRSLKWQKTIPANPIQPPAERRQQRQPSSAKPSSYNPSKASKPATLSQLGTVRGICATIGVTEDDLCERFHISSLEDLNYNQVQEVFDMQKQFKASLG